MRRIVVLLALLATVAGCGGGGGGGSALTHEEFVSQADAVCGKANDRGRAINQPTNSFSDVEALANDAIPIIEEQNRELHKLKPPEADKALVSELLAEFDANLKAFRDIRDAARDEDESGVREASADINASQTNGIRLAKRLGMKACAEAVSVGG